ncbi:hypothetical protein N7474_001591 [Penicillium riverlandense]|uniref:uncharacterized protein n=1 Tax=Penicillium riverlandense TaxID=1903569 RepID=UPI0025467A29|nr:uncharacterized protein N7474_001591 [Penicillium riverlandense]KAJ5833280.1 hypothetical protein N7474_001591 [Penicillium riverlandense]
MSVRLTAPKFNVPTVEADNENAATEKHDDIATLSVIHGLAIPASEERRKRFWWKRDPKHDPNAIATQISVFDDPASAAQYQPRDDWENIHRFDPEARWTWGEESRVVRKLDLYIMVFAYFNLGNTVNKVCFLLAEIPSQLIGKRLGPDRWIPIQLLLWSVVSACQFWLKDRATFLACRALLGILQSGFISETVLFLSYFYTHSELSLRLSFFYDAISLAEIIASFLAVGLLSVQGVAGVEGWRWLFLIEGLITLVVGLLAVGLLPPGPTQTRGRLRGRNGWFSEREETIIVNRLIREDPGKGTMHNRQPITQKLLWQSLRDYDLWPLFLLSLVFQTPASPPGTYLTLSLTGIGFNTIQTNLLTVPYVAGTMITMWSLTYFSEVSGELCLTALFGQVWVFPFLVYMNVVDMTTIHKWKAWAITSLFLCYPSAQAIQVGWVSRNSNVVRSRAVSAPMYNMVNQVGAIIASNIYRANDAPRYATGNKVLLCLLIVNIFIYLFTKFYYVMRNRRREAKWNAMTKEEKIHYLETTTDEGNKRLDFRFAH